MKTKTKYINVACAFALALSATALAAQCLLPYNIDESGSCGGAYQPAQYPGCEEITYAPDHRSECDPNTTGTYDCKNVIAHVMKTTYDFPPISMDGGKTGSCLPYPVTSNTIDTGQLCLWANAGTQTCP